MRPEEVTMSEALQTPARNASRMLAAMMLGVAEALRQHREQGVFVITWDPVTQQIVETQANQIPGWIDATPDA